MKFCSLTQKDLHAWALSQGLKPYLSKQVFSWVYDKHLFDMSKMSNIKKEERSLLQQTFSLPSLQLVKEIRSEETIKFLWQLEDGHKVESVLIFSGERRTLCISSQVGCRARCAFCASGKKGFFRHLTSYEIVEQALLVNQLLQKTQSRISHIVFMGMGEPLENIDAVLFAIKQFCCPTAFGISPRRITVSTVGIVENMRRLAEENGKVHLVLSLHAPNQHVRKKIIPYARKYPLEDVLEAADLYAAATKRDITYEYILIDGLNAEEEHAKELCQLLQKKQCTVNLIPYNPVDGVRFKRPSAKKIDAFMRILQRAGVPVTRRYTKGAEIAAACGQLAYHEDAPLNLR